MTSRIHPVALSIHEVLVLAFYRALPLEKQLDMDGLLGRWWCDTLVHRRFSEELQQLGAVLELSGAVVMASDVRPFVDASQAVIGVERRAAA